MIEDILVQIASTGESDLFSKAGEHLVGKIKNNNDFKKLFVSTGEFFANFESESDQLSHDIDNVLSKDNMKHMANRIKDISGYSIKECLLSELLGLMKQYDIPRDHAYYYANNILYAIIRQLPEIAPEKYDQYFQSEWKKEQEETLQNILQKIEKIDNEITVYNGRSISIQSADQLDIRIRKQTNNPSIGIEFFEIDDELFKDKFEEQKNNEIIRVRTRCREEGIYCIINELWKSNESRAIFVVKSLEDWNKLSQMDVSGNIYIPWFFAEEICAIENNTNIFIYTDGIPSFSKEEITLRPRTFRTICNALENAGMDANEASVLVSETHGLYIPMKKKIFYGQYLRKPEWIDKLSDKVKKTALLVGQWTDSDGDQEIISLLSGMKYEEFIDCIMPFTKGEDPFIYIFNNRNNRTFYLASVENTWDYIDVSVEDNIWETFNELFIEVLNEAENLFIYSTQERLLAQINGEKLFWSSIIRDGMIRTLIMRAFYKNDTNFQNCLDELVDQIMKYIKNTDQWKYISNFFVDLCEVSPKSIINRLFQEFDTPTGLMNLFESQSSDFLFGKNDYIHILWGVDRFLVQYEYAAKGYEWLLRLDDKSYEYKSNSPKDTIEKVLCSWHNFSVYRTPEEKTIAAKKALELDHNAWDYIYKALPTNHNSFFSEIGKPKYRPHVDSENTTIGEMNKTVIQYVNLLIDNIDFNVERMEKLLQIAFELQEELFGKIFSEVIFQSSQMSDDEKYKLKISIRKIIYRHRYFKSSSWAMSDENLKRYDDLLDAINTSAPEYDYAYFFYSDRDVILLNPIPYDREDESDGNDKQIDEIVKNKIVRFKRKHLDFKVLARICSEDSNSYLGTYYALYGGERIFNKDIFKSLYDADNSRKIALDYCRVMISKDKETFSKVIKMKDKMNFDDNFIASLYYIEATVTESIPLVANADDKLKDLFWKKNRIYIRKNYDWALSECKKYGSVSIYIEMLYQIARTVKISNEKLYDYIVDIDKMYHDEQVYNIEYTLSELLKPLQKEYLNDSEKARKLIEIEIHFFELLKWENMICFKNEIKKSPDIFAEMVSIIYKKDSGETKIEQTDEQRKYIDIVYRLYDRAKFCPAEKDGLIDANELDKWISDFKELLKNNGQTRLFGFLLGRLFAYSPQGMDNYYPCEAVRGAIEKYADDSMVSEFKTALYNKRGIFSPSAGRGEKKIAEGYKENADYFKLQYPKTSEIYYDLFRRYTIEAEEQRRIAENEHF